MASSRVLCTGPGGTPVHATSRSACRSQPAALSFAAARSQAVPVCRAVDARAGTQLSGASGSPCFQHQALASQHALAFPASHLQRGTRPNPRRHSGRPGGALFIACSSSTSPSSSGSDGDASGKDVFNKGASGGDSANESDDDLSGKLGDWREFRAKLVRTGIAETAADPAAASAAGEPGSAESATADSSSSDVVVEDSAESRLADSEVTKADLEAATAAASSLDQASAPPMWYEAGVAARKEQEERAATAAAAAASGAGALWAHPLAAPEQGCLVIAHPAAFGVSQQYFNQAVIFLFTHGPEGSAGVILNRPSQYSLSQVAGLDEFVPEFAASPLYIGGDVGPTSMLCLHGIPELAESSGAQKICEGVFLGGSKGAKEHIQRGASAAMDYRWFARYAGWAPGQLEREVESGYWFLAASSPRVVLKHCIQLEKPLWREVMEMMGGEFEKLSKRTYGES